MAEWLFCRLYDLAGWTGWAWPRWLALHVVVRWVDFGPGLEGDGDGEAPF